MRITVFSMGGMELAELDADPSWNRRVLVALLASQLARVEHTQTRPASGPAPVPFPMQSVVAQGWQIRMRWSLQEEWGSWSILGVACLLEGKSCAGS